MFCKKCDCEIRLQMQDMQHTNKLGELLNMFLRLRRDMAWLEYKLTGNDEAMKKLNFELKNGEF